jgi:hypothetical protein
MVERRSREEPELTCGDATRDAWIPGSNGRRTIRNQNVVVPHRCRTEIFAAIRWAVALVGLLAGPLIASTQAQDSAPPVVRIEIRDVHGRLDVGLVRNQTLLRVAILISAENISAEPVAVSRPHFSLVSDQTIAQNTAPEETPMLDTGMLAPGESVEGWIAFAGLPFPGHEIPLTLKWEPGQMEIPLDEFLRRPCVASETSFGPQGCLKQLAISRRLDVFAAFAIAADLKQIFESGIQRIVFVPEASTDATRRPPVVMDEFLLWLSMMIDGADTTRTTSPIPPLKASFRQIALAGFTLGPNRSFGFGRRQISMFNSPDEAISAALAPVYRVVHVGDALRDLESELPGIRRAAMAGVVDRLTAEQSRVIIDRALSGTEEDQQLVASYLHLIPGPEPIRVLEQLVHSEKSSISSTAVRSLVASREETAGETIATLWTQPGTSAVIRSAILSAVVESADERWLPLMKEFVTTELQTRAESSPRDAETLTSIFQLLELRGDNSVCSLIRSRLLEIDDPAKQDLFLRHLMECDADASRQEISRLVNSRVVAGTISDDVIEAINQQPSEHFFESLLEQFGKGPTPSSERLFQAMLSCASASQLNELISGAESFPRETQVELLIYLNATHHDARYPLAARLIQKPGSHLGPVLQQLVEDSSDTAIAILCNQLTQQVESLEGTREASTEGQQHLQAMMAIVARLAHPECRRTINRLSVDPNDYVNTLASEKSMELFRHSASAYLYQSVELPLRERGETEKADAVTDRRIEVDPFLAENYTHRASIRMHAGRFEESMSDLFVARRLSPEDPDVESLISLVLIRQEKIREGLDAAEELVKSAPSNWVALYNAACSYSRATESSIPSDEDRIHYANRAIELLQQSAKANFPDHDHMLKDEDLVPLHNHAQWEETVGLVRKNDKAGKPDN